ncbi:hypothetical protein CkaCkLH20_08389 [Colletotrichum karsti]|uniref:Uncharacterized protein n=1 Tax=Colletotrichum karsti TaxID=1095194 RepID=A0A9P6HZ55_9PEZI|nr:uncharacterized protein CkaCkLH20_08389 [Colletotrichum karsti]KAF9874017.1 hypothetical protein CkaCkLH20_08389 [Colletotrichum karsti]
MAASSRGIGLMRLTSRTAPLAARPLQQRLFTTCNPLLKSSKPAPKKTTLPPKKPTKTPSLLKSALNSTKPKPAIKTTSTPPPPPTTPTTPIPPSLTTNPAAIPVIRTLLHNKTPTLLYESGSHLWMKISTWGAAAMFWGYGLVNYGIFRDFVADRTEQLGPWVSYAFVAACVACTGFGSYFFRASHNIVRSIHAVPTAHLARAGALPRGVDPRTTPLLLEIRVKKLLPGPAKKIFVRPEEVRIPFAVYQPASPFRSAEQISSAAERKRREEWEYDKKHMMTVPIRHAGRGLKEAWFGVQRALTKSGFMKMEAGGEKLKLDVASCWALDEGRALDRLVDVMKR